MSGLVGEGVRSLPLTCQGTAQAQRLKPCALLSLTIVLRTRHDAELSKHVAFHGAAFEIRKRNVDDLVIKPYQNESLDHDQESKVY